MGFSVTGKDARKSVKNAKVPILILHGESDTVVPCEMSEEIYNANPKMIKRYTFPGADHGLSYIADTERYKKVTNEFLDEIFGK